MSRYFGSEEILAILTAMRRNLPAKLEIEFANHIGTRYALATSYGRTAIYLALKAIGVSGKEVIVPAFACSNSVIKAAVRRAGATPLFAEIDVRDFNMQTRSIERLVSDKTTAIVPIHTFGCPCNIAEILAIAKKYNLKVVEDCAHALGAEFEGRKVGTFGDAAAFSLTKNMVNFGGGVMVTNDDSIYRNAKEILQGERNSRPPLTVAIKRRCRAFISGYYRLTNALLLNRPGVLPFKFKWWLFSLPPSILEKSIDLASSITRSRPRMIPAESLATANPYPKGRESDEELRMHAIVASVGLTQLRKVDVFNHRRIEIARKLHRLFESCGISAYLTRGRNVKNVYTNLAMWCDTDINRVVESLKKVGLLLRKTWPAKAGWPEEQCTRNINLVKEHVLTMELHPLLSDHAIMLIGRAMRDYVR
jgi:dTDP-4-amino-4,6-dideoxygalactose transaminase